MKTRVWILTSLAIIVLAVCLTDDVLGRGGRGGAFGRAGGWRFRGGLRPGLGVRRVGWSGVGLRPGIGFRGRPWIGSSPSFGRPWMPVRLPGFPVVRPPLPIAGARRPIIGGRNVGPWIRPSFQPARSPIVVAGAIGSPPAQRPSANTGMGFADRHGASSIRLPRFGETTFGSQLPSQGARISDQLASAHPSLDDRRANLSDRLANRGDWPQNHQNQLDDRQEWLDQNREDWQNWTDNKLVKYGDWYHDSWQPSEGWNRMWDNYPVAATVGLTSWGLNRTGYGWGYSGYSDPYYSADGVQSGADGYDYSKPLVTYVSSPSAAPGTAVAQSASSSEPQPTDEGLVAFEESRAAFRSGDFASALSKIDTTLKTMPDDAVVHEFRSLVLFALKKYPESAAAIYAVLSTGPGWDWTTMVSLYSGVERYTEQLRALESFVRENPKSEYAHFLLGYHYLTMGHESNASKQFQLALAALPDDKLLQQLVAVTTPPDESAKSNLSSTAVPAEKEFNSEQFIGNWKASNRGTTFQLNLVKDGSFTWAYTRGPRTQILKGVFAVNQNNLALEAEDGSETMLAEVEFVNRSQFKFKMVGDDDKKSILEFTKE